MGAQDGCCNSAPQSAPGAAACAAETSPHPVDRSLLPCADMLPQRLLPYGHEAQQDLHRAVRARPDAQNGLLEKPVRIWPAVAGSVPVLSTQRLSLQK